MLVRRLYGLLNTLNYVLILAGPILVALAGFSTFAAMARTVHTCIWEWLVRVMNAMTSSFLAGRMPALSCLYRPRAVIETRDTIGRLRSNDTVWRRVSAQCRTQGQVCCCRGTS